MSYVCHPQSSFSPAPNPALPPQTHIDIANIMASGTEEKQISALYWECIDAFRRLFKHLQVNGERVEIPEKLSGAPGQLQVWAENVGAHRHNSTLSLDYKLREASRFRGNVKVLLVDLKVVVEEGESKLS
ncbi:hypothetical protein BZA77DRAFT_171749 [Pyronema omphalodes]|nr:hypothetical protein BZA77DRAFT_171749 [Pyronema omphalodes]